MESKILAGVLFLAAAFNCVEAIEAKNSFSTALEGAAAALFVTAGAAQLKHG